MVNFSNFSFKFSECGSTESYSNILDQKSVLGIIGGWTRDRISAWVAEVDEAGCGLGSLTFCVIHNLV